MLGTSLLVWACCGASDSVAASAVCLQPVKHSAATARACHLLCAACGKTCRHLAGCHHSATIVQCTAGCFTSCGHHAALRLFAASRELWCAAGPSMSWSRRQATHRGGCKLCKHSRVSLLGSAGAAVALVPASARHSCWPAVQHGFNLRLPKLQWLVLHGLCRWQSYEACRHLRP
jgi:hypothetical protein